MLTAVYPELHHLWSLSAHGFHRVAYALWGDAADRSDVTLCVHGLTRSGRDFDVLAERLAGDGGAVYCPDVVGRGRSDWLPSADAYGYPQYMTDMTMAIARSGAEQVDWVGTSMGGLIGLMLAAQPKTRIRRLVLNDVGPFISASALRRLSDYVGKGPHFADFDEALAYIRHVHAPFGPLDESEWRHLSEHSLRVDPNGGYRLAYDPAIAAPLADPEKIEDMNLWGFWDAIACPVLVLRGAESDLLTRETAQEMTQRGPKAELVEFEGVGHAPALLTSEQVETVAQWLQRDVGVRA